MYQLDPKTDLIDKCNRVIRHVREKLIADTNLSEVQARTIAEELGLDEREVCELFGYLRQLPLTSGGTVVQDGWGYTSISVGPRDFEQFLTYESIEALIVAERPVVVSIPNKFSWNELSKNNGDLEGNLAHVHPIFSTRIAQVDRNLCFVLMPFSPDWSNRVYRDLIRKNVEKVGLQCLRADNLTGQIVIEDIWIKINQCGVVIADVTGRNPNVMYELGIVHTIGKPCIFLTQDMSAIPFDFRHLRHYVYNDNSDSFREHETKLPKIVSDVYRECYGIQLENVQDTRD